MRRRVANKVVNKSSMSPKHRYKLHTVVKAVRTADIKLVQRGKRRMMMQMLEQYVEYIIAKQVQENAALAS